MKKAICLNKELKAFLEFLEGECSRMVDPNQSLTDLSKNISIKDSDFGKGVFAKRSFKKGDTVCYYTGAYAPARVFTTEESKTHALMVAIEKGPPAMVIDGRSFARLVDTEKAGKKWIWGCGPMMNSTKDTNRNPNVEVLKWDGFYKKLSPEFGFAAVRIIVSRPVKAGQELVWNYAYKNADSADTILPVLFHSSSTPPQPKKRRITLVPEPVFSGTRPPIRRSHPTASGKSGPAARKTRPGSA